MIRSGFGRSRGSDAAGGCTVKEPLALRIVRPFCFTAASVLGRSRKDTERFAFARYAPKNPPTDPAPTIRICFIMLLTRIMDAYYTTQIRWLEMRYNSHIRPWPLTIRSSSPEHTSRPLETLPSSQELEFHRIAECRPFAERTACGATFARRISRH